MRIVFAGTPAFAASALAAIIQASYDVALVLTQPDRAAGRGMKLTPSPVKQLAQDHGLAVATPETLSLRKGGEAAAAAQARLRAANADVVVVAAYGLILPQAVLDIPAGLPDAGCGPITAVNIHGSLLPRWRGAAPVARRSRRATAPPASRSCRSKPAWTPGRFCSPRQHRSSRRTAPQR